MTAATVAIVRYAQLDAIAGEHPDRTRKLRFARLTEAAIHRAWLFRLGRLDAVGRVAHLLCETNVCLVSAGLSDGRRFALGIIQADLAEFCGLASVVNWVTRHMREDRPCVSRSSLVEILQPDRLADRDQFDPAYLYIDGQPTGATSIQTRLNS